MTEKSITLYGKFQGLMERESVQAKFETLLEKRAPGFISSLLSIVNENAALQKCDHNSILTSAAKAAILQLPIEQSLGFAYIVPYKSKATFILGYKGMIQLAIRTGQYEAINADAVYAGEEIHEDRLTGKITFNGKRVSDEAIGFFAYFKLKTGFEKFIYMTTDEVHAHAKTFSQSYGKSFSAWTTNFCAMAKKTVLRRLLGTYGIMSIDMQDDDSPPPDQRDPRLYTPEDATIVPRFDIEESFKPQSNDDATIDATPRPIAPENLLAVIDTWGLLYHPGNCDDSHRQQLAKTLTTIFDGDKTKRYEWSEYYLGDASCMKANGARVLAVLKTMLDVSGWDAPPSKVGMQEVKQSHAYALEMQGQQRMEL